MVGQRYVIYVWETESIGPVVCARSCVGDKQEKEFIESLPKRANCRYVDTAIPVEQTEDESLIGKVIVVTSTESVFSDFLGRYAVITDKAYADKWVAEFNMSMPGMGGLSHTISEKDFRVVGTTVKEEVKENDY